MWCDCRKKNFGHENENEDSISYRVNDHNINPDSGKVRLPIISFVDMENVSVDILHMFLRITDRLVLLLHKKIEQADSSFSQDIDENPNFKKLTNYIESLGIKKPYKILNNKLTLRDLNGVDKLKLFNNIDLSTLFPGFGRINEVNNLWVQFRKICFAAKDDHHISDLKKSTEDWYALFSDLNYTHEITPYCHIFGYHLDKQVNYLNSKGISFNKFSMQGLEKQNDFFTQYYHRSTNKKGEYITQIMMKRSRIKILSYHPNIQELINKKKESARLFRQEQRTETYLREHIEEMEDILFETEDIELETSLNNIDMNNY